ncbi:MAG: Acriflavin resistance protein [uncultured Thiotrichaceae bacterium]|uniref:Acriflavin resistance protein n=1 Tax=uncultured Thiotrichaceae bacterium TaxID=298394 RepID=A0A6S6SL92_9GAMM|nr:MAG: Acriflavin resistance protein [uncultured Thiotrichaceae bacterium]
MHSAIAWFVRNPVAANIMMIAIVLFGLHSLWKKIPLEVFPSFDRDVVNVLVSYPGATPTEVEQGIVLRIEDAISDLTGIDKIYADAAEGSAQIRAEIRDGYDVTKVLNEIKGRIDAVSGLPEDSERPVVEQQTRLRDVITVVVAVEGNDEVQLRNTTEMIRDEIRNLPDITQVGMGGIRPWEINIIIPNSVLEQYGLSLDSVAAAIRASSRDIPGGSIKTAGGEILVRALGQAYRKDQFANISILSSTNGARLRLGDIAQIVDGFSEDPLYSRFDGRPAAFINVYRVGEQNAITLATTVKDYLAERTETLPAGIELSYWRDGSKVVKARLNTLVNSATQGMGLVLLLLALFLRPSLAFWVSLGIPISFMGAFIMMPYLGVTMNIISMFAFILVLGIVVDDAIVTGENVYTHMRRHNDPVRAAIEGTQEISVPVTFGVLTTVAAFMPLLLLEGRRAPIFMQIPLVVIPVLLFSLIESKLILPAHLRHMKKRERKSMGLFGIIQQSISNGLEKYVEHVHRPILEVVLHWRYVTLSVFVVLLVISIVMVTSGRYKYVFFPRIESEYVSASLQMPEGTPIEVTARHISRMTSLAEQLQDKYREPDDSSVIQHILVTVGSTSSSPRGNSSGQSHIGNVSFELIPPEIRQADIRTRQLVREWQTLIGEIPGVKELSFRAEIGRGGEPINVQLTGSNFDVLNEVGNKVKARLGEFDGLFDIKNSFEDGKTEVQLRVRPDAEQLGLDIQKLGTQVRNAIFGAQAQRIQRDQSEVKVMVRYPQEERYSLSDLQNLNIRTPGGAGIPLSEVADVDIGQGTSKISRVDRKRILNVTADLDKDKADATAINAEMNEWLTTLLKDYPGVRFDPEGEQREQREFGQSLQLGFGIALLMIYVLLAIPLQSYTQPLMVMIVIPFSIIGALGGHMIMGLDLSISSIMGLLALIGVVVNDSLVLVDYTNKRLQEGMKLIEAIRYAGGARFRPILLTSLTTFAGLTPLILEKSTQAQFLIPMAVSLGFGILFATFLTLFLIPSMYLILEDIKNIFRKIIAGFTRMTSAFS